MKELMQEAVELAKYRCPFCPSHQAVQQVLTLHQSEHNGSEIYKILIFLAVIIACKKRKKFYFACSSISIIPNMFPSVSLHCAK